MGKVKWGSKNSNRKGVNLRAPATAHTQAGPSVLQVHWTPVFARGKIRLFVCDPQAITAPHKLNDSIQLAKLIRSHLTEVLHSMQQDYGWPTIPRVVVHDKASYMVNSTCQQLNPVFKGALVEAGFRSWISEVGSDTTWVAA